MAKLLHKRKMLAFLADSSIAQFCLTDGSLLQFRVVVPSGKYSQDGFYKYVTYQPVLIKANGKKVKLGSGLKGQPYLDEIEGLSNRFRAKVVGSQREAFRRFCLWLKKDAAFTTARLNKRHVALIRDLLTAKGNYYFRSD